MRTAGTGIEFTMLPLRFGRERMRIFVHDYAGHPFPCDLSRTLARRGHWVRHIYAASNPSPRGILEVREGDAPGLDFLPVHVSGPIRKESYWRRRRQELAYAKSVVDMIERDRPDIVLSGNTPSEVQRLMVRACRRCGARFVAWVQDIYGVAVHRKLRKRIPLHAALIGRWYMRIDDAVLQKSDAVVLISEDFLPFTDRCGVDRARVRIIHNWAPLNSLSLTSKDNPWSRREDLAHMFCLVYSGTLGMKHNPRLLLELAMHFRKNDGIRLVVVSEGTGPNWLRAQAGNAGLDNVRILGWVPPDELPQVLATGDILLAILEPDAGVFSVPSKVLTYLCARRPMVLAVPPDNLAARIVHGAGAGLVVPPDDVDAFIRAVETLVDDPARRAAMAERGRAYAETHFDIERITDSFEEVFSIAARQ